MAPDEDAMATEQPAGQLSVTTLSSRQATPVGQGKVTTLSSRQATPVGQGKASGANDKSRRVKKNTPKSTRNLDANTLTKGDPEDVKTLISIYDSEPKLGAYLGYTDIAELRKFALSFVVIEIYIIYQRHCHPGRLPKNTFELLRDTRNKEADFPSDLTKAVEMYPIIAIGDPKGKAKVKAQKIENDKNSNYLLATLIFRLAERIENAATIAPDEAESRQEAATAKLFSHHSSAKQPPPFDVHSIKFPRLGPVIELEEDILERYNRAYHLLRYLSHSLMPSRWNEKFSSGRQPFQPLQIHPSSIPLWMAPAPPKATHSIGKALPKALPKKSIMLRWSRDGRTKSSAALETHIRDFIEYNELQLPKSLQMCGKDPRVFPTGEMWRDTVRRQLALQDLNLEFVTMHVESLAQPDDTSTTKLLVYTTTVGEPSNWEEVKRLLLQTTLEATFSYTLKPIGEDEEFELEHQGPPLALTEDLRLDEGNDVELQPPEPSGDAEVVEEVNHEDNAYTEEQMAEVTAFLSGAGNSLDKKPPIPQSEFSESNREDMLAQHDDYDVLTPEGLLEWQIYTLNRVCMAQPKLVNEPSFRGNSKVTPSQRKELAEHRAAGEQAALSIDVDQSSDHSRYYQIQAAFTGSESQVGPLVEDCKVVFGMRTVGKHGHHKKLDVSVCDTLSGCDVQFLDSQINGAAFMMQRSTGGIPVSPERASLPDVAEACKRLTSIQTFGGWLVDATGFGKTITCLLFVSQWALYSDHSQGHKPTLIVVPNGAVFAQWCEAIWDHFRDIELIISNDIKPAEAKYMNNWVSSTAMREAPSKVDNWPEHLRYVFDTKDPRASRTVFVTPWDTHKERTMDTDWVPTTKKSKKPQSKKNKKRHQDEEPVFVTRWKGFWGLLIADEAHRLRHMLTKTFVSISQLEIPVNWLPTATPVMNSLYDTLAGLYIFWISIRKALACNKANMDWLMQSNLQGYEIFDSLKELPHDDIRRTVALDPKRIEQLLNTGDVTKIAKYYHIMDELVSIRRSTASILKVNDKGDTIELKTMMPPHTVKTVELNYTAEEATEAQWFHRLFAREYSEALTSNLKKEAESVENQVRVGPDTHKQLKSNYAPTTGPLRRLALSTKSTKLARLDVKMRKLGYSTLVKDMEAYRAKGHGVEWLINMTKTEGDGPTNTRLEQLAFLTEGSPTGRFILSQLRDYVLAAAKNGRPHKITVLEETPICAWFWELICNHLYIGAKVMHSGLNNEERIRVVKEFNSPKTRLMVFVLMYNVGSQGTNLDACCSRAIVATSAISSSVEIQAWGRIIRVSQKEPVSIIRCQVLNSHDQQRDARQQDKAIMDMATRSYTESIRTLLVDLLNEANAEVREAHESAAARQLFEERHEDLAEHAMNAEWEDDVQLAKTVQDTIELDPVAPLERSQRSRRKPDRLRDDRQWLEDQELAVGPNPDSDPSEGTDSEKSASEYDDEGLPVGYSQSSDSDGSSDFDPKARNDNPEAWIDGLTENAEVLLESRTRRQMRQVYNNLTRKEQESWDQDEWNLKSLLALSPERVYTLQDLEDEDIHDRALRLLYRARFGQSRDYARISPHINYTHLHKDVSASIKAQVHLYEGEMAYYAQVAKGGKATKDATAHKAKVRGRSDGTPAQGTTNLKGKERASSDTSRPRKRRSGRRTPKDVAPDNSRKDEREDAESELSEVDSDELDKLDK